MQKVWIIWSPLLYFYFKSFLDPNSSSFIRFECILHDSGVLLLEYLDFYKLKKEDLISIKLLSAEVALYLYKSTIRPYMEYCYDIWAGANSCYLDFLDKLQKRICRIVGPSLASSLEPLAHCWNVASLSLFYRY